MWHNQRKKNQTIEKFKLSNKTNGRNSPNGFPLRNVFQIDFIIYSVHFTSVEIPSGISRYLSLISSISTHCCCMIQHRTIRYSCTHTDRERHNTHRIETMEKRKIAQWSKLIVFSLTDQTHTHTPNNYAHSFSHSLSHYAWVVKKPIAYRLTRNCVSQEATHAHLSSRKMSERNNYTDDACGFASQIRPQSVAGWFAK